jgi:hypothetical protein
MLIGILTDAHQLSGQVNSLIRQAKSMILQRGITGFFLWNERGVIPEFGFEDFQRIVFSLAPLFSISDLSPRGVTPNFHSASLRRDALSVSVLGHSIYPLIAFTKPLKSESQQLHFVDCELVSQKIALLFPSVKIATAGELDRGLNPLDITQLDSVENDQISYWQPKTVGEVAFNWWD